jgi:hypothetical protein
VRILGGGQVLNNGVNVANNQDIPVSQGSNLTLTFDPFNSTHLSGVVVDGTNIPTAVSSKSYTFSDVRKDYEISVMFEAGTPIRDKSAKTVKKYGIVIDKNPVTDNIAKISVRTPEQAQIKLVIYDNLGSVLFEKSNVRSGEEILWDLTNIAGRKVANGTYLVIVEANANGKLYKYSAKLGVKRQ